MTCCGMLLALPREWECWCPWLWEEGGDVEREREASESAALALDGAAASLDNSSYQMDEAEREREGGRDVSLVMCHLRCSMGKKAKEGRNLKELERRGRERKY